MENITIEKMEIKRFNALLMRTIVGMLFMGVLKEVHRLRNYLHRRCVRYIFLQQLLFWDSILPNFRES